MAQQKQDEYSKQLASKVDVLTTHNKMLEAQIIQKPSLSSRPPDKLPSKPKHSPCEHYNCVNLKQEVKYFTNPEDIQMEEGSEITMARSKERNEVGKTATFIENETVEIPTVFPPKLSDEVTSLSLVFQERWILRELYAIQV